MCRLLLLVMFAGSISCLAVEELPGGGFTFAPDLPLRTVERLTTVQNLTDANGYLTFEFEPMYMIVGQKGLAPPYRVLPLIPAINSSDQALYNIKNGPEKVNSGFMLFSSPNRKLWTVLDQNLYLKLIPIREGLRCQSTDPFSALFAKVLDWFNSNPNCLNNAKAEPIKLDSELTAGFGLQEGTPVAVPLPIGGGVTAQIIGVIHIFDRDVIRSWESSEYSVVRKWADHYAQTLFPSAKATPPTQRPNAPQPVAPSPSAQHLTDANGRLTIRFEPMSIIVGQKGLVPPYRVFSLIPALVPGQDDRAKKGWVLNYRNGWKLWDVLDQNLYLKLIPVREGFQDCPLSATNEIDPFPALFAQVLDWFKNPDCLNNAKMKPIQLEAGQTVGLSRRMEDEGTLVAVPLPIGGGVTAQIIGAIHTWHQIGANKYSVVRQWADRYAQTLFSTANATQAGGFTIDADPPLPPVERLTTVLNLTDANGYLTLAFEPMYMIVGQKGLKSHYRVLPLIPAINTADQASYYIKTGPEQVNSGFVLDPKQPGLKLWTVLDQNLYLKLIPLRERLGCRLSDISSIIFAQVLFWFNNNPNCLNDAKAEPIKLDAELTASFGSMEGTPVAVPLSYDEGVTAQIIGVIYDRMRYSQSSEYSVVRKWADRYAQTLFPGTPLRQPLTHNTTNTANITIPLPSAQLNLTDAKGRLTCDFEPMWMVVGQKDLVPPYRVFPLIPAIVSGEDYGIDRVNAKGFILYGSHKLWTVLENNLYLKLIPVRDGFQDCQSTPFSALFAQVLDWFKNPNCLNNAKVDPIQLPVEQAAGLGRIAGLLVAVPFPIGEGIIAQIIGVTHTGLEIASNQYSVVQQWADRYAQTLFPPVNATA